MTLDGPQSVKQVHGSLPRRIFSDGYFSYGFARSYHWLAQPQGRDGHSTDLQFQFSELL